MLYQKTEFTMAELRHQREVLMCKRLELIERHRKLSNRILIQPFLQSAQPPTPPASGNARSYDSSWIKNLMVSLAYDAVREVDISRPNRKKIQFYTALSNEYEELVDTLIAKSMKQELTSALFDELWKDVIGNEIRTLINQCIGEIDIAQSLTSSLILQSILRANKNMNNFAPDVSNEYQMARNLMDEMVMERSKRKSDRFFHKLQLQPIKSFVQNEEQSGNAESLLESVDLFEGTVLSALQVFDIKCLEKTYLPPLFENFSLNEIALWKHIESELFSLSQNAVILALSVSPSNQYCVVSIKEYILVIVCKDNCLIFKTYVEIKFGDCIHFCWLDNEQEVIVTTSLGYVCLWSVFGNDADISKKQTKHSSLIKSMKLIWSFNGADLRLSQGLFAQTENDVTIKHFPVEAYAAPLYTATGEQSVFIVICRNNDILRVCIETDDTMLQPEDIPKFEEIKNVADCGVRFDICRGHTCRIINLIFKDEYTFYSFDEQSYIIRWEYSKDSFDAYGLVIADKYFVEGNDVDFVRLVKGQINHFNTKGAKTRQEAMQAAKSAGLVFSGLNYGEKAQSCRENTESGLIEKLFVKSVSLSPELDLTGTIMINKIVGHSLFSMKSRQLKLKNCEPSKLLGITLSPCNTLMAYCYLFSNPLYGVKPYLSILLLRPKDLTFMKNKIKIFLTSELAGVLNTADSFSFCLTSPHFLSKAMYLFLRVGKSMMVVSTATSNIVRTTLDLHKLSSDNLKFFSEKNVATVQGTKLFCDVWGHHLILYGSSSKQILALTLKTPTDPELTNLFYKNHGSWDNLAKSIDPYQTRLLVKSSVLWGKVNEPYFQQIKTVQFMKSIVGELVHKVLNGSTS